MKKEKLQQALNEISDSFIAQAASAKPRRRAYWLGSLAAALALVILCVSVLRPVTVRGLVASPDYPKMAAYSESAHDAWWNDTRALHDQPKGYADSTETFFRESIPLFLNEDTPNPVCSPLSVYMALAMLAETTAGESQQQLLDLLGSNDIHALRNQATQVWEGHYWDDGMSTSVLGTSLWLDESCTYNADTVRTLADSYYASVYRGELGSEEMNSALQTWLNEHTGGLLEEQAKNMTLSPRTALALASTVFYQVEWYDNFFEEQNTDGIFHGAAGDVPVTYMNQALSYGPYYWGDDFGAVSLSLKDDSWMWLILPDEGTTPQSLLKSGQVMELLYSGGSYENQKRLIVNLSLPKFDIAADMDLKEDLQALGISHIFDGASADFSPIISEADPCWVDQVDHAARVAIDEKGVTAAAYTVIILCGAGMPPDERMDFILDRPFLFIIESNDGLPLFTGIVNQP